MTRNPEEPILGTSEEAPVRQGPQVASPLSLLGQPMMISGIWAVADQVLISGASFATMLLVGRAVAPSQLAAFVLAYTGFWFFQNIQRALIVEPMNVLGAVKDGIDYRSYVTSTAVVQAAFAVVLGGGLFVLAAMLPFDRSLLSAFAIAVVFWQFQEFGRRIFYTHTRVSAALLNQGISYVGQVVLLTVLYIRGELTPASAMMAIAVTRAIAAALGAWQVRSHMTANLSVRSVWEDALSNWRFGRWLLGEHLFREAADRLYVFLLIAFVGPAGVGAFVATGTLARVNNVLIQSMDTLLPPVASRRLKQRSQANMEAFLRSVTLVAVVPALIAFTLVFVFADKALHIVYGGTYDEYASVLRILCLSSLLAFPLLPIRVALKAKGETRVLFLVGAVSSAFLVTGGSMAAAVAGVIGAAWVLVLNSVIALAVMTIGYWSVTRRRAAKAPAAESSTLANPLKSQTDQHSI